MATAQATLFDAIPDLEKNQAAIAFELFRPTFEKLQRDGLGGGRDWWRSRWYEWVGYSGHDSHAEWKRKNDLERCFPDAWAIYEQVFRGAS